MLILHLHYRVCPKSFLIFNNCQYNNKAINLYDILMKLQIISVSAAQMNLFILLTEFESLAEQLTLQQICISI